MPDVVSFVVSAGEEASLTVDACLRLGLEFETSYAPFLTRCRLRFCRRRLPGFRCRGGLVPGGQVGLGLRHDRDWVVGVGDGAGLVDGGHVVEGKRDLFPQEERSDLMI